MPESPHHPPVPPEAVAAAPALSSSASAVAPTLSSRARTAEAAAWSRRGPGVSRRAVIAGAVWSAPVTALALAAPAAAASGTAIAFAPSVVFAASRSQSLTLAGTAPDAAVGTLIGIGYPPGFGGPATATVGADGAFTVTVRCPVGGNRGVVTAAAPGHGSGSVTVSVFPASGGADEGTVTWSPDAASATFRNGRWEFPAQSGSVSVSTGRALPTGIALAYPAGYEGPDAVAVAAVPAPDVPAPAVTGVFVVEGISAAPDAAPSGEVVATPMGQSIVTYLPASAPLRVELAGPA